jgi:hypothetical protein
MEEAGRGRHLRECPAGDFSQNAVVPADLRQTLSGDLRERKLRASH